MKGLVAFSWLGESGVEAGEFEISFEHMGDGGKDLRVLVEDIEDLAFVDQIGESICPGFLVDLLTGFVALFIQELIQPVCDCF